jgi:hypothetical protein
MLPVGAESVDGHATSDEDSTPPMRSTIETWRVEWSALTTALNGACDASGDDASSCARERFEALREAASDQPGECEDVDCLSDWSEEAAFSEARHASALVALDACFEVWLAACEAAADSDLVDRLETLSRAAHVLFPVYSRD